jgi:hypothetical protein
MTKNVSNFLEHGGNAGIADWTRSTALRGGPDGKKASGQDACGGACSKTAARAR